MRILQVTPRYPPHTGGVETHVKEISERLVDRGHDVVVHTADAGKDVDDWEVRNGVEVCRHRGFAPGDTFHVAPGIVSAVRRGEADVVHAHNYHSLPMFFAALGVTDERFIVTTHYHGESTSGFRDQLLSVYKPLGKWAVQEAGHVIAVSDWERKQLREDFGVDATVIPNGVDIEQFADATPEEHDRPYILTVGRLEEYKGVQHVVKAMSDLEGFDLLVAGSGPYREALEQVTEAEGVEDQVEFLGYVEDDRLPRLYAGANVYVTLSEFEAYGMTVAEALAAGTPCVVSTKGALADWADRRGCVRASTTDPLPVLNAIREALNRTPDASELPSWDEVSASLETKYNSVLSMSDGE